MMMKKVLLFTILPMSIIAVAIFFVTAPRSLSREERISEALTNKQDGNLWLDPSSEGVEIVDYREVQGIYAKLKIQSEEYERIKQRFSNIAIPNKDLPDMKKYEPELFLDMLKGMNNVKLACGYQSMKLDDYDELIFAYTFYTKKVGLFTTATSGENHYVLAKETNGDCYLYVIRV